MTPGAAGPLADLSELLHTLCRVPGPGIAPLLGDARPSERSLDCFRVEPTRFAAFAAIEVCPWSDAGSGIALPELTDPAAWPLAGLEELLGPLSEGPRTQGRGAQLQGFLDDPSLPARAAVYVILERGDPDCTVHQIRIRVETMAGWR